jgi:prepilin-type N-terminal cleavage/methylation domain-containing protein
MARRNGFSAVEVVLVLVVVLIIGAVGYLAYNNLVLKPTDTVSTTSGPVKIETASDLDGADTALDNVSVDDDSDSSQLDSAADSF